MRRAAVEIPPEFPETETSSPWVQYYGRGNEKSRDERLSRFVKFIAKHLFPPESYGLMWVLAHREYEAMIQTLNSLGTRTIRDATELRERAKNPLRLVKTSSVTSRRLVW